MIVLYHTPHGEMCRSEVRDASDVGLEGGAGNSWNLVFKVSEAEYGALYGRTVYVNMPSRARGVDAIRKMCENVRFVDLTKYQENQ